MGEFLLFGGIIVACIGGLSSKQRAINSKLLVIGIVMAVAGSLWLFASNTSMFY